jgi:hypothetical protein
VPQELNRPRASAASDLQNVAGRTERVKRSSEFVPEVAERVTGRARCLVVLGCLGSVVLDLLRDQAFVPIHKTKIAIGMGH